MFRPRAAIGLFLLTVLWFASVPRADAQEWYDFYQRGQEALEKKQAVIAAGQFERAIRRQPTPGTNLLTYGTNRIPQYYPYVRLAEALAMSGDFVRSRLALERSEASGKEPADERARVLRLLGRAATPEVPKPTPAPTALPTATSAPTVASPPRDQAALPKEVLPLATPSATPPPAPAPVDNKPAVAAVRPPAVATTPVAIRPAPPIPQNAAPTPEPSLELSRGVIRITTQPGSADVYLDGEFIGRSDSSGALVKRDVPFGPHTLRVGGVPGFVEETGTVEVAADTQRVMILSPAPPANPPIPSSSSPLSLLAIFGVALAGITIIAWLVTSRRRRVSSELPATDMARTEIAQGPPPAGAFEKTRALESPRSDPAPAPDAVTAAYPAPPSESGVFGEYELIERIGKGGMASVYRARRRGEDVALKRPLVAFLSESEFVERFSREAAIGRTLNHPNIIRIFEKGHVGNIPYFTMELVDGETLHSLARREGALPPVRVCQIIKQVAEALDYAHLKGVVHRDLKPSNIMILASGVVKVMDYGIARSARLEALTATGAFLGTPEYIAPETAEGGQTDARSDLYSLGVIFYEILTGVRPFVGDTPFATLRKICSEPPTPPSTIRNCPEPLESMVLKLLRKNPSDRHASAEDLLNDLNDYLNRAG